MGASITSQPSLHGEKVKEAKLHSGAWELTF